MRVAWWMRPTITRATSLDAGRPLSTPYGNKPRWLITTHQYHHAVVRAQVNPSLANFIGPVAIAGDQGSPSALLHIERSRTGSQIERHQDRHRPLRPPVDKD